MITARSTSTDSAEGAGVHDDGGGRGYGGDSGRGCTATVGINRFERAKPVEHRVGAPRG